MTHFAKVVNGTVVQVIVAEHDFFNTFIDSSPGEWVETSYNTKEGIHLLGGTPLRKNYAGIGFTYNKELDAFIPPQPFKSWILDENTCTWRAPLPRPESEEYFKWNEITLAWDIVPNRKIR